MNEERDLSDHEASLSTDSSDNVADVVDGELESSAADEFDRSTESLGNEAATESTFEELDDLPPVDDDAVPADPASLEKRWYILKAQVNRETSVCDTLRRRVQRFGLGGYFGEMLVPTEDVREFTKAGKSRIVKRKLYPGYIMVNMALTEESWWLVRDTPGIGDFTSMGGKPTPLGETEIEKILKASRPLEPEEGGKKEDIKTSIKQKVGDKVRVKDGNFENFEGEVSAIDERNGRVTVLINIFGRLNPVELDHWQVEGI
ncbi:MAG: transcription termination/antitermination factor NusG [Planctomycetaceae bacterium]|nr:transcription termination/antitermination factor NusG [Planctomycetaceae bacterium]